MNTNSLKKITISAIVMVLGFTGACMTTSMTGHKVLSDKIGYRFVSAADPCQATKLCSNSLGPICKSGTAQLWGKLNESDFQCIEVLYEKP